MRTIRFCAFLLLLSVGGVVNASTTGFFYTSSSTSWVGQGESIIGTPAGGFSFVTQIGGNAFGLQHQNIGFFISDSSPLPRIWTLALYAPITEDLAVGHYADATRASFTTGVGLNFDGQGRGNSHLTGFFDILEANFDTNGQVVNFAADFTQFDEGVPSDFVKGGIRINSSFAIPPVPEPSTVAMLLGGLGLLGFSARRKVAQG